MSEKKTRDSGIELLRIIAMMMVIGIHLYGLGNYYEQANNEGGIVRYISIGIRVFMRPAVNIFILITGYFMVKMKFNIKKAYKRVFKIYLVVLFYSVVLSLIALLLGPEFYNASGSDNAELILILKMLFPVTAQNWYFISQYIMLCLLAPFLNIVLQNIKKKDYHVLLAVTTFLMSIWFTLADAKLLDKVIYISFMDDIQIGKSVFSFMYLYIIGGYIRLHVPSNERPNIKYLVYVFCYLIMNGLIITVFDNALELEDMVLQYSNPLIILMAVCFLMYFKDLHFKSKIVNSIASTTLGVYAVHNFKYSKLIVWEFFDFRKVDCSNIFLNIIYIISIIIIIFGVCAIVDLLRQKLFEIIEKKISSKQINKTN